MINKPDSNKARLTRHRRVRGKVFGTPERSFKRIPLRKTHLCSAD